MDLGHHGLESQAGLQSNVRSGPNTVRRMPLNIKYEPRTRDSGRRAVQRLQKQVAPEHFSFISAASVRCSPFCNFRRRVNSDRLLESARIWLFPGSCSNSLKQMFEHELQELSRNDFK